MPNTPQQQDILSSFQLFALIFGAMLGIGALNIGRYATYFSGRDGWICVFIAGLLVFINGYILMRICDRFPGKTFFEIIELIFGKFIGKMILFLWMISFLVISAINLSFSNFIINTYILYDTPPLFLSISMLSTSVYLCVKNLKVIGRIYVLLFLMHIVFFFFFLPPIFQLGDIRSILPIAKTPMPQMLLGIVWVFYTFCGFELLGIYYPLSPDPKRSRKSIVWALSSIVFLYTIASATQIITMPIPYLQSTFLPSFSFVSIVFIPFLERVDLLFVFSWIFAMYKAISVYQFSSVLAIEKIFSFKNRMFSGLFTGMGILGISLFLSDILHLETLSIWFITIYALLFLFFPILLLTFCILFRKGTNLCNG